MEFVCLKNQPNRYEDVEISDRLNNLLVVFPWPPGAKSLKSLTKINEDLIDLSRTKSPDSAASGRNQDALFYLGNAIALVNNAGDLTEQTKDDILEELNLSLDSLH
eukprot:scaffold22707_cov47-Attheya_sp.AAC.2